MKNITLSALGLAFALASTSAFAVESPAPAAKINTAGQPSLNGDTNKDGFITKEEWQAHGEKTFNETDTDHDGKLSKEERKAFAERRREELKARRAGGPENAGAAPVSAPAVKPAGK